MHSLAASDWEDKRGRERKGDLLYREPRTHDLSVEERVVKQLSECLMIGRPRAGFRVGASSPVRKRRACSAKGMDNWHHLFTPRQLLMNGYYSQMIAQRANKVRTALTLSFGDCV